MNGHAQHPTCWNHPNHGVRGCRDLHSLIEHASTARALAHGSRAGRAVRPASPNPSSMGHSGSTVGPPFHVHAHAHAHAHAGPELRINGSPFPYPQQSAAQNARLSGVAHAHPSSDAHCANQQRRDYPPSTNARLHSTSNSLSSTYQPVPGNFGSGHASHGSELGSDSGYGRIPYPHPSLAQPEEYDSISQSLPSSPYSSIDHPTQNMPNQSPSIEQAPYQLAPQAYNNLDRPALATPRHNVNSAVPLYQSFDVAQTQPGLLHPGVWAFELWLRLNHDNHDKVPVEQAMGMFRSLFGESLEAYRSWFARRSNDPHQDDSGYHTGLIAQGVNAEIKQFQTNQWKCNKKQRRIPSKAPGIYHCTSRCKASFSTKGTWSTHEKINYPQEIWVCSQPGCLDKEFRKRVRFRKDKIKKHLMESHGYKKNNISEDMVSSYRIPIPINYHMVCQFSGCGQSFYGWKERNKHIAGHFETGSQMSDWIDDNTAMITSSQDEEPCTSSESEESERGIDHHYDGDSSDSSDGNDDFGSGGHTGGASKRHHAKQAYQQFDQSSRSDQNLPRDSRSYNTHRNHFVLTTLE